MKKPTYDELIAALSESYHKNLRMKYGTIKAERDELLKVVEHIAATVGCEDDKMACRESVDELVAERDQLKNQNTVLKDKCGEPDTYACVVYNVDDREVAVRNKLIGLGWVPPENIADREREMEVCAESVFVKLLPKEPLYLDPPDGGDVHVEEQLRRYIADILSQRDALETQVKQLASAIYNAAIGQVSMGYSIDGEGMAQFAYEVTGINAEECNWLYHFHADDQAVDRFASAMKVKLAAARDKGRCGWDDKANCSGENLAQLLVEHMIKANAGTFEDVANFAMMLHQRGDSTELLAKCLVEHDREVAARAVESIDPVDFIAVALRHVTVKGDFNYQDVNDAFNMIAGKLRTGEVTP